MMAPEPAALPDDVLAEVLQRLSPLVLAASRRVCRAWRDLVDARLRGHLLSRSVRGIFINFIAFRYDWSEFFSCPSTGPAICGGFYFLPTDRVTLMDHCNGLLLCGDGGREYVVNPATRRWARLPRRPPPHMRGFGQSAYLAFDPAVSPHYEVFVIPRLPVPAFFGESDDEDDSLLESEWPPASCVLHVFSSMADQWDEKTFLRQGEAAGVVADRDPDRWYNEYHAVYWRSVLYIHGQHGYLTRMSMTNHTYRVIRLPGGDELRLPADYERRAYPCYRLGRSLRGVYCARINHPNRLQLWHLDESRGQTEWVVMHDIDLEIFAPKHDALNHYREPAPVEEKYDWNSDEDNVLDIEDAAEGGYGGHYHFLGFHPYKEIVYLYLDVAGRGLAYDWNKSRFQDLGSLGPMVSYYQPPTGTDPSFAYMPCWMGEFPGNELETLLEYEKLLRRKLEMKAQREDESNYTFVDEYELRKLRGHAKRVKDSAKIRRRHRIAAQQEPTFTDMKSKTTKFFDLGSMDPVSVKLSSF
ncbi:unnamed protein product [Alopecurus aequalis]